MLYSHPIVLIIFLILFPLALLTNPQNSKLQSQNYKASHFVVIKEDYRTREYLDDLPKTLQTLLQPNQDNDEFTIKITGSFSHMAAIEDVLNTFAKESSFEYYAQNCLNENIITGCLDITFSKTIFPSR